MTDHATHPVVITRPRGQAAPLAQRVAAIGREAILFPLLEIHPLPDLTALREVLGNLAQYAMAVFVSPNAIDAVFSIAPRWPSAVAIGVMGKGSVTALAQHGITAENARVISPRDARRTDSQTLLDELDLDALRGKRVLIVRGESGREWLADALRSRGVTVEQVAAYRRCQPVLDATVREALIGLLERGADWVITSSEALRFLMQMIAQVEGDTGVVKMQQQRIIVPHVRIAETARELGLLNVALTGSGDESLVAALQSGA